MWPVRALSFIYPAGLVRDWLVIIEHNFSDVSICCSEIQSLVSCGPIFGSVSFQIVIDCHFELLQSRLGQWVEGEQTEDFSLYSRCVEEPFKMSAVFAS